VVAWARANSPRFPDWDTAIRELASMIGVEPTPAIEAFVRSELTEVDGEICDNASPESVADLLLAVVREDFAARARTIAVPTLLIACGQPPEHRAARQNAWEEFARASPLIELHVAEQWSHNPLLQDPQGSASLIADWLSAHL
jgi:pimeloyl-ACP methyl ester carboxylesterase